MADPSIPLLVGIVAGLFAIGLVVLAVTHWRRIESGMARWGWLVEGVIGTLAAVTALSAWTRGAVWLAIFLTIFAGVMLTPALRRLAALRR